MRKPNRILLSGLLLCGLSSCSLDMKKQDVTERVEMHAGSRWFIKYEQEALDPDVCKLDGKDPPDDPEFPRNAQAARFKYLVNKEVSLTPAGLEITGSDKQVVTIPLILLNRGLNCEASEDDSARWSCTDLGDEDLKPQPGSLLAKCLGGRESGIGSDNYVGFVEDRYCVFVRVYETKGLTKDETEQGGYQEKFNPTNINRDKLRIAMRCADFRGGASPKAIVGGPRPNYRQPGVTMSVKESTR